MHVKSVVLGAVALLSGAAVAADTPLDFEDAKLEAEYSSIVARTPCHPKGVHVIGASGAGRNNLHSYGLLGSLVGAILADIPQSTNFSLPYPKGAASADAPDPGAAIATGVSSDCLGSPCAAVR